MSDDEQRHYLPTEYGIEVYRTERGYIAIKQDDSFGNDESIVILSPERADRLVGLLRAVNDEILTDIADAAEARHSDPPSPPLLNA